MVSLTTQGLYAEPYRSLSVGVATLGRYIGPTHIFPPLGGAPPYKRDDEEHVAPLIFVHKVEMVDIDSHEDLLDKIRVKLKDDITEDF
jgi:hypothetical protein